MSNSWLTALAVALVVIGIIVFGAALASLGGC